MGAASRLWQVTFEAHLEHSCIEGREETNSLVSMYLLAVLDLEGDYILNLGSVRFRGRLYP